MKESPLGEWEQTDPTLCGENLWQILRALPNHGTPPRRWGQFSDTWNLVRTLRYTPTYIGTFRTPSRRQQVVLVRPHVCGNNAWIFSVNPATSVQIPITGWRDVSNLEATADVQS